MTITKDQATAALRRMAFRCLQVDGISPKLGATFSGTDIKIGKNYTEADFAGTVTELGGGWYFYEATVGEVNTLGTLSLRSNVALIYPDFRERQIV